MKKIGKINKKMGVRRLLPAFFTCFVLAAWAGEGAPVRASIMLTEPWGFYERDPDSGKVQLRGIGPDFAALLEAESGVEIHSTLTPYPRIWRELADGDTDISWLINSPDRDAIATPIANLFNFGSVVIARRDLVLERYEDLRGLRIGVLRNIRLSPRFDADGDLHKIEVRDYETMVHMLREGRLDAIAGNSVSFPYLLKKLDTSAFVGPRLVLQSTPTAMLASRRFTDAATLKRLSEAAARLNRYKAFEAVLDRWVGRTWRVDPKTGDAP